MNKLFVIFSVFKIIIKKITYKILNKSKLLYYYRVFHFFPKKINKIIISNKFIIYYFYLVSSTLMIYNIFYIKI